MREIGGIIQRIGEVSIVISAAVEEQSMTTRDIASSVQGVSDATAQATQAMEHVVEVAANAVNTSGTVLTGAAGVGVEAETLHTEIERFLTAIRSSAGDRRLYERVAGNDAPVTLSAQGRSAGAVLRDVSRGGASLGCDWTLAAGTAVEIDLPDAGGKVTARVASGDGREVRLVFGGDPSELARIDRLLGALGASRVAA